MRAVTVSSFFLAHVTDLGIAVREHVLGGRLIGLRLLIVAKQIHHRLELGVFPRQVAETILIVDDFRVREQASQLLGAGYELL